jgi:hypothetical protein
MTQPDCACSVQGFAKVRVDRRSRYRLESFELPRRADVDGLDEVEGDGHGHNDDAEEGHDSHDQDDGADKVGESVQPLMLKISRNARSGKIRQKSEKVSTQRRKN